jgi:protein involved in polysaccharide export with SLBB domain
MDVPYIGRVTGAGKTCRQIAYEIKPRLEKEYFVRATVIIALDTLSPKPRGQVSVTGQVRSQGIQEIMPNETLTLSKAIIRAGGLADFGEKKKVKLTRKKANDPSGRTQTTIHDLQEIIEKGHLEKDPELKPGDLIYVPERLINI